ncbi:MAG: type I restriction enzyme HsdR N-terminal domain-containing protein [Nannocystaceae bacterium]
MTAFHDQLQRLAEQVRKRLPHVRGEEATKQALILPFLSALGYDIYDPTEVQPEFTADFAKKRSHGQAEKVDYAIHRAGVPVLFVECKAADAALGTFSGQLARYFNSTPACPVAILTNGVRYVFYTDLDEKNILSDKSFFEIDILRLSEAEAEVLEGYTRDRFDPSAAREQAEEIIYTNQISSYIGAILRSPSEAFTRFVLGELGVFTGKKITAKVIDKFTPTIKRAIQATLLDMATRSIKEQSDEPREAGPAGAEAAAAPAPTEEKTGPTIVTTPEETEALEIIKGICEHSALAANAPILHRDTASWFTISVHTIRRWFIRLYFNQRKKSILTRVAPDQVKALAQGFEVDGSRVYINSPRDLLRLRALLLFAFEEAARQGETNSEEESDA